ncbi:YveK family protein [Vagococcus fluvialis]|uniref:YveK family protein n=1 Tax=Vagococcus fluvialis TaxID=2738 RepID=UPI003D0D0DF0
MEETISLQEIFSLFKKKVVFLLSMFFIGIGISAVITFFAITPKYNATSQLIATTQNKENNLSTDNINSNLMMINTYKDFIKSSVVTEATREQLQKEIGFKGSAEDVKNMISVEQAQSSQMFSIVATSKNMNEAAIVANVVANIFKTEAKDYTDAGKVSIISKAEPSEKPVSPNKKVNLAIGGILGLIIGVGLVLLSQLFDKTVKSVDYVTDTLGVPVLGQIPILVPKEVKEAQRNQLQNLEHANLSTESIETEFSFGEEEDGLNEDLLRINGDKDLQDTIDLSDLNINYVDLSDLDKD